MVCASVKRELTRLGVTPAWSRACCRIERSFSKFCSSSTRVTLALWARCYLSCWVLSRGACLVEDKATVILR